MSSRATVYWNGTKLTGRCFSLICGDTDAGEPNHQVSISVGPDRFVSVLARPENGNRTVGLALDATPETGIYVFKPKYAGYEFDVRIEYTQEPYPETTLRTHDAASALCGVEVGDEIEVALRKDMTPTPGVKHVGGRVISIVDCCGLVPNTRSFNKEPDTVLSVQVALSDIDEAVETAQGIAAMQLQRQLTAPGDRIGVLNVTGTESPLEFEWEGRSDTPRLQVESITVIPESGEEWTVTNESLPELRFDPVHEYSRDERVDELRLAFDRLPELNIDDATLKRFVTDIEASSTKPQLICRYASGRSENTLTKSGTLHGTHSVYDAEANRAKHQVRFASDDGEYYLLVDTAQDAEDPVSLYSVAVNRHWDSELGHPVEIEVTENE